MQTSPSQCKLSSVRLFLSVSVWICICSKTLSFSGLTAIFPSGPGLVGTRMSILDLLELKNKAPVKLSPPTDQQQTFLQAECPSCRPINSVKAPKENLQQN